MTNSPSDNYTQYINRKTIERFSDRKSVVFGQNITAGSRISGLGASLDSIENITAINTPNVENALMGFGLGLMLSGTDSAFIMKQHDFALLGLDQLTNTVNALRSYQSLGSFVIIMVVVDSGYEGPQASLNNLDEFASLSRSPVYFLNTKTNIDAAFEFSRNPGLHIMALSQKSMKMPVYEPPENSVDNDLSHLIRFSESSSVLFIYFGLALEYIMDTQEQFKKYGVLSDLLIVAKIGSEFQLDHLTLSKYDSIIVMDTSKSEISYAQRLVSDLRSKFSKILYIGRICSEAWGFVSNDLPEVSPQEILEIWRGIESAK